MQGDIIGDFNSIVTEEGFSASLRASCDKSSYIPSLRENHAALYRTVLYMQRPLKILEAGTLYGYSAVLAAEVLKDIHAGAFRIDTVEIDPGNADIARKNIEAAGFSSCVRVIEGDACEVFSCLEGPYDLIFLDCSKSSYNSIYDDAKRLLRNGGLLMADDVCYHGKLEEGENVPHKHRTIVYNLREFLERVSKDGDFAACIDKMDDGMLLAVKKYNCKVTPDLL